MKCAYLFSGQPIFYQDVLQYTANYQINCDDKVCSHLWWDNSYFDKVHKLWFSGKYQEKDLDQKFVEKYGVTDFLIEKHKNFDLTFFEQFNFEVWKDQTIKHYKVITPVALYSLLSQTYSNYQAFLQTQKYTDIDVVIRSRPDIVLVNPLKNILSQITLEEDTIYFQSSMSGGHLYAGEQPNNPCDWFFLGTPSSMEKYCHSWYNLIYKEQKKGLLQHCNYIDNICRIKNLNIKLIDFGAIIYKQATNWYENYKVDPKFYTDNFNYDKFEPLKIDMWPHWVSNVNFKHFKYL